MQALQARLMLSGAERVIGAHAPVVLRDPETVWWIQDGMVDVFAVAERCEPSRGDGGASKPAQKFIPGPREHLYRADRGQLFFGIDHANLNQAWTLIAVVFSALIGVVFGIYPARRAARLNPVDALRYE